MTAFVNRSVGGDAPPLATLTLDQYHRMNEVGILPDGSPIELLDGILVLKDRRDAKGDAMPVGPRHVFVILQLQEVLRPLIEPLGFHVRTQGPVTIPPNHEPEPDVSIAIGQLRRYADRHPGPDDVVAVIEVAGSSLAHDRDTKLRIYADAGIATYWIVDLAASRVERHESPIAGEGQYAKREIVGRSGSLRLELSGTVVEVPVGDLFPK